MTDDSAAGAPNEVIGALGAEMRGGARGEEEAEEENLVGFVVTFMATPEEVAVSYIAPSSSPTAAPASHVAPAPPTPPAAPACHVPPAPPTPPTAPASHVAPAPPTPPAAPDPHTSSSLPSASLPNPLLSWYATTPEPYAGLSLRTGSDKKEVEEQSGRVAVLSASLLDDARVCQRAADAGVAAVAADAAALLAAVGFAPSSLSVYVCLLVSVDFTHFAHSFSLPFVCLLVSWADEIEFGSTANQQNSKSLRVSS
jgi:hypothetical protein